MEEMRTQLELAKIQAQASQQSEHQAAQDRLVLFFKALFRRFVLLLFYQSCL